MSTAGIIAEYNPFHKGHLYQIKEIRKTLNIEYVIIVMSGDFVQRGAPALFSKYDRTRMALLGGADLVLELPAAYSTASAERFAMGGVQLLNRLGIVDYLSFGCETDTPGEILEMAKLLVLEEPGFKEALRSHLASGDLFPAARMKAFFDAYPGADRKTMAGLFTEPNNILGLEYCKALIRTGSRIRPAPLRRAGQGYHDTAFIPGSCASASAIRDLLHTYLSCGENTADALPVWRLPGDNSFACEKDAADGVSVHRLPVYPSLARGKDIEEILSDTRLRDAIPETVFPILGEALTNGRIIFEEDLDGLLHYRLLMMKDDEARDLLDVPEDLVRRLRHLQPDYRGFLQFSELLKTRNRTLAGIRRALIHILLDIKKTDQPQYCRVLGFRKSSSDLLHQIRAEGKCELIIKPSASASLRNDRSGLLASELYRSILLNKRSTPDEVLLRNELQRSPVIIA